MIPTKNSVNSIDGMELIIDWNIRHQMAFVFEIDTDLANEMIPAETGLQAYEARPGVALMFMGYNDYYPGNIIYGEPQPEFIEITRMFMVQPDLSIDMPLPRFTFYMHQIASNNPTFIKQEIETLHLPSYYAPTMVAKTNEAKTDLFVSDKDGKIRELLNTHPNPTYRNDSFYGQYFTLQDDQLYFGVFYWSGHVCIHQREGYGGGEFDHPYLSGLDKTFPPEAIKNVYMQLITTYDAPLVQRFYRPRLIGKI